MGGVGGRWWARHPRSPPKRRHFTPNLLKRQGSKRNGGQDGENANKRVNERAHGSTGSASITVTITVFCGAADGIADGISVRLHNRSLVLDGWFRHPFFLQSQEP
ncbi:hypothetical protein BT093_11310 [Corynebacterium diphtheriae]|nr:hypothetical protein BT093_11310 [Corynebacterium diphtheriae]